MRAGGRQGTSVLHKRHQHGGVCVLPFASSPIIICITLPGVGCSTFGTGHRATPLLKYFQRKYQWHLPFGANRVSSLLYCGWILHACPDPFPRPHLLLLFSHWSYSGRQDVLGSFLGPSLPRRNYTEEKHWGSSPSVVPLQSCHFSSWLHDETMHDIMVCAWKTAMCQKGSTLIWHMRKRLGRQEKPNVSRRKMKNCGIWLIPEATPLMLLLDASSYKNSNYAL